MGSTQKHELIGAGVDWITASATIAGGGRKLQRVVERELLAEQLAGCELKEVNFQGYKGLACGGVYGGILGDRFLVRLSSHLARDHWREVAQSAERVSRLDVQATIRYEPERPHLESELERQALKFKRLRNRKHEVELRRNDVRGATLYTGRRTSLRFGRTYDKARESKHDYYQGAHRFEVETHVKESMRLCGALLKSPERSLTDVAYVRRYFGSVGILVPVVDHLPTFAYEPRPTVDRSLRQVLSWYSRQVRPSLSLTVCRASLTEVLDALGLTEILCDAGWTPPPERSK